jgi:hypothetical protein
MSTSFIHGDEITWTLPASWPVEVRDQLGGTESGVVDEVIDGTLMVRPHGADHVIEVDPATAWHTDPHTAQLRELMTSTPLDNRSVLDMVTDAQSRLALVLVAETHCSMVAALAAAIEELLGRIKEQRPLLYARYVRELEADFLKAGC